MNPGVRVYENAAYGPSRALAAGRHRRCPRAVEALTDRIVPGLGQAPAVLPDIEGYSDWSGPLDQPGELFVSAAGDGWKLEVDGSDVTLLGGARAGRTASPSSRPAPPRSASTPRSPAGWPWPARWLLWVIALVYLLRVRVREDESTELPPAPTPAPEAPAHVVIGADFDDLFAAGSTGGDLPTMAVPVVAAAHRRRSSPPAADEPEAGRRGRRRRSR